MKTKSQPDVRSQRVIDRLETEVRALEQAVEALRFVLGQIKDGDDDDE